jgi:DNA-binding SARP family transcriptional activator
MMTVGGEIPGSSLPGQPDWRLTVELLEAGQYERVADLLDQAQAAIEQEGDPSLAQILAAALRICLACRQCRAEADRYQHAYQEVDQREHELRQQLHAILDLVGGHQMPEARKTRQGLSPAPPAIEQELLERDIPRAPERRGLWRRIQSLLRREPVPRFPQAPGPDAPSPRTAILPSAGRVETPEDISREKSRQEEAPPSLLVYCLGPFRVYHNNQLITDWDSLKARSILKYLVAHRGTPIGKEILMDIFWQDADPEAARRNLHQAIYSLRQALRRGQPDFQHVQFESECYLLNPELEIWLDFGEFEEHAQAGRRLEVAGQLAKALAEYGIAEGLYQGDFLEEDLYEDWARVQREHLRNMYLDILGRLIGYYLQQGEYVAATALCQKILAHDNCHEEAHRRLMHCYLAQGQRHLAMRQYQACVESLKEELDLTPSEETAVLYQRITAAT